MDDSVSEFIVRTCQMLPKSNTNVFNSIHLQASVNLDEYIIFCGSIPEFFIQPLHSCIDDVDIFMMKSHSLAFTDEKPVVPYDVRHIAETIDCLLIEPYLDYPAFVRLRVFGQMRYNLERNSFEFIQANDQRIITTTAIDEFDIDENDERWCKVGPARRLLQSFSLDLVISIWCPHWPNEAKDWPLRQRKYGLPTIATIHEVVQTGCHVVPAKHPACRNDIEQFRLSFSLSEVILLQSWTQVQQIVYHMLRFFAKREVIYKDCLKEDEVLCTYHFKTLMLWSCEEMSSEWWHSSVIGICRNLLEKLAQWLKETRCPNYFIPMSNLFHEHFSRKLVDETVKKLIYYCNSDTLSLWFVKHYVLPGFVDVFYANCTPDIVSYVYEHMLHTCAALNASKPNAIDSYVSYWFSSDVQCARDTVKKGRKQRAIVDLDKYLLRIGSVFEDAFDCLPIAEIESCYWLYGSMLRVLHAAHLLESKEMHYESEWFVDEIRQVLVKSDIFGCRYRNLPRPISTCVNRSQLYFIRAHDLMKNLTGSNDDIGFQVRSEVSKGLLRKALDCEDSKRNTIGKATLAYLAALNFAASEYQIAIDLCSRVNMDEKYDKEDTETLNAGCLLYIEDISMIIGFYLIFRKTRDTSLHYIRRPFFVDLRLTPEVFAHHLYISSIERTVMAFGPYNISQTPTFPLDAILITTTNRRSSQISRKRKNVSCVYQRIEPMNKLEALIESSLPNEDYIIQLLMEYSLRNMRSFYNAMDKDFGIHCNTADCYRAAYLYQCHRYPEVFDLCERILDEPDLHMDLKELAFANVMVLPPLDSYFDGEVRCLLGFHTLFCYLLPLYADKQIIKLTSYRRFIQFFVQMIHYKKCLLSVVLDDDYIRHYYFLGRHFLARYLKVRCLIDYCNSLSQAMLEFKKLKSCFPFEHIVRCFLKKTLRQLQKGVIAKY